MHRIVIVVEGCLDAALASHLARATRTDAEVVVARGKHGVARLAASLASASPTPVLGLIDADEDAEASLREAAEAANIADYTLRVRRCGPAAIRYLEATGFTLVAWCDAWSGCRRGTVEDIVVHALREAYDCAVSLGVEGCRGCPSRRRFERLASKLLAPLLAAACSGRGTLVATRYEKYCGVDLEEAFEELGLAGKSRVLACYASLIASSSRGTSSAPR